MFTTDGLQSHPDFVFAATEHDHIKVNTNPRYKFFRQSHFTAGDYSQFLDHWDATTTTCRATSASGQVALTTPPLNCRLPMYANLTADDVFHTFEYIFNKFKKGIFLKLVGDTKDEDNHKVFLPFSKVDYKNEWHPYIRVNHKHYGSITEMMRYIAQLEARPFVESRIHYDMRSWYGNNGLVRLEYPTSESDNGVNMMHDMFVSLVQEKSLPSCELFINKRDFPILTKDGTEAYEAFFGRPVPMRSYAFKKYAPVLSMTTTDHHADIPIPTWDDWCRVEFWAKKKVFAKEFRTYPTPELFAQIPWESKKATAVFRGASTGLGTTCENNPRLYFSLMSSRGVVDTVDGLPFLDAGITKWNLRPRKAPDSPYLETIRVDELPFALVAQLSPLEQARYKFILHLPGHSAAYRLSLELYFGSVILLYPCKYKLWYSHKLVPYVHYVPVDPSIPEDIYNKIRWCKHHDDECRQIAQNAREFAMTHLSRDGILNYLHDVLWTLHAHTGSIVHPSRSLKSLIENDEASFLVRYERAEARMLKKVDATARRWVQYLMDKKMCHLISSRMMYLVYRIVRPFPMVNARVIKPNKVWLVDGGGRSMIRKRVQDRSVHEVMVSFMHLNHIGIPNFNFTYGYESDDDDHGDVHVISDYVPGSTLEEMIQRDRNIDRLLNMLRMICLAIEHAQGVCGFMHNDLYPWNIIVKQVQRPVTIRYRTNNRSSVEVTTSEYPVIIDYGRSHVVHDGRHYSNVSPFRISSFQDIISIVFTSLHTYLSHHKVGRSEAVVILGVMKFFESKYAPAHCIATIATCKTFLREKKKFSNMLMDDKDVLNQKRPLHFYTYLSTIMRHNPWTVFSEMQPFQSRMIFQHLPFIHHLFDGVVLQATFLEIFSMIGSTPADRCAHINRMLTDIHRGIVTVNPSSMITARDLLYLNMLKSCLEQMVPFADSTQKIRLRELQALMRCTRTVKRITIPSERCIRAMPLLLSHPMELLHQERGKDLVLHYNDGDWIEMYAMHLMHPITTDGFAMFTRCFRNFCIQKWLDQLSKK